MTTSLAPKPQLDPEFAQPTAMELIQQVISAGGDPMHTAMVIKELAAIQQAQERFAWEREERQARIDYDNAMTRCQKAIGRIAPNQSRGDTKSTWADYAQLDRAVRPIYTSEGFSISFREVQSLAPGKVRIEAEVSRGGISKMYHAEITPSTTGPQGKAMATATDADAIAQSRAKRYIMLDIFNIAVGIDREEKAGIPEPAVSEEQEVKLQEWADALRQCDDLAILKNVFADAYKYAKSVGDKQKAAMSRVYEECKRRLL